MIADILKSLRESKGMTQTEVAKKLKITRSSVNAWEMGISVPSTQYIIELSRLFDVSSDYILGISKTATVSVGGLTEKEVSSIINIIDCYRESHNK